MTVERKAETLVTKRKERKRKEKGRAVETDDAVDSGSAKEAGEEASSEGSDRREQDGVSSDGAQSERNKERRPHSNLVREDGDGDVDDGGPTVDGEEGEFFRPGIVRKASSTTRKGPQWKAIWDASKKGVLKLTSRWER